MPKIIVVGSANVDLVTRVPRAPKPGESIIGHSFATVTGGKGANQAVAAARLGGAVTFLGCVGNDAFGQQQREGLAQVGVDVSRLKVHATEPTGTAVILVADEGQNSIVVTPAANYGLTPDDIFAAEALFRGADAVLLQLEIPLETVEAALDLAGRAGILSILDAGPAQKVSESLLCKASIVSPNETEAEMMTGLAVGSVEEALAAALALQQMGAREVVLKLGAQGSLYLGETEEFAPAFSVEAVDSTAAGDAFTAALALVWRQVPVSEALRFANAAGALAATVHGAQPAMPTRRAVEAFLQGQQGPQGLPGQEGQA
ncbi:MAG: ribokinase [Candidatus Hydrogenedentes bacterium]|nr:ribokinase [Candidatus Hydrogenedentota bacterium]